jgi:FtsP/CotA-like multicopper oxidase with cupredoxin domain
VNGAVRPRIEIAPEERQFWRIVNASADRYLDLELDGQTFQIVALDGMPVAYHEPKAPARTADHFLLAPGGRLETMVTGPPPGSHRALRTLCVDTGPDGDPNPGMVLADLAQPSSDRVVLKSPLKQVHPIAVRPARYKPVDVERLKQTPPRTSPLPSQKTKTVSILMAGGMRRMRVR